MPKVHLGFRILICLLFILVPLNNMDEWFYDHFFLLRRYYPQISSQIVLVRMDAKSLVANSKTETTRNFKVLIDRITSTGPKMVIIATPLQPNPSLGLNLALQPNVIFSNDLSVSGGTRYGFNNIFPDPDNVVRKAQLIHSSKQSIALKAYKLLGNPATTDKKTTYPIFISYLGPHKTFKSYNATDIITKRITSDVLANKLILIGTALAKDTTYETPVGPLTRLEIQANIIDSFLYNREIRILPRWVNKSVAALMVILSIFTLLYFRLPLSSIFLALIPAILLIFAITLFFVWHMWLGVAGPIFCIFSTYILMLGYKLNRQEEHQWKIQQESVYLKEMDQFKNNFISLFSHDLKTPIAKIKAITERLITRHASLPQDVVESLRVLDKANEELARFISDILKVTKIESMHLELSNDVIDINRLVENAVERLKFHADEKRVELIQDLEPLFSMEGDLQLIQEVITNLIENAIKYSPSNSRVVIRTSELKGKVKVEVIDEGEGIPIDELPRVTGKFYRGKSVSQTTKGSGLGLYLSKYFVELHRGKLKINSEFGKGTVVSFWLPIKI